MRAGKKEPECVFGMLGTGARERTRPGHEPVSYAIDTNASHRRLRHWVGKSPNAHKARCPRARHPNAARGAPAPGFRAR